MLGAAVVIGSGRCVWDDLKALEGQSVTPFAINDMALYAPEVKHAASHHPDRLMHWVALRTRKPDRTRQNPREIVCHSSKKYPGIHHVWEKFYAGGSSALLGVRVALELGFRPVLLAGVPLDTSGHIFDDPVNPRVYDFRRYRSEWEKHQGELRGKGVRGVSGFLRELLGKPDA